VTAGDRHQFERDHHCVQKRLPCEERDDGRRRQARPNGSFVLPAISVPAAKKPA
jgi:hypothetical protein